MSHKRQLIWVALLSGVCASLQAQSLPPVPDTETEQVVQPEVERREIVVPHIDVDDFELGLSFGILDVEEFGSNAVAGVYLDYHITETVFIEVNYAASSVSDSQYRRFGIPIFDNETENLQRYGLAAGYAFLPGEMFFSRDWTMPSAMYVIGGLGSTLYADEQQFTYDIGIGLRVLPSDGTVVKFEMHDYMFESDLLGSNELRHNLQFTMSFGLFF